MTGLRQLQLVGDEYSPCRIVPNSLPACPSSLQYLALVNHNFFSCTLSPPSVLSSILPQLMHLTSLQLSSCLLSFCGQSVSSLSSLKGLGLRNSLIQADKDDWKNLEKLTNLTHLDISGSVWGEVAVIKYGDYELEALGHLNSFTGWPALKVIRLSECGLFKEGTDVRIQEVEVLDITWLKPDMKSQELHMIKADASVDDILECVSEPFCIKSLVCLSLGFKSIPQLTDAIKQLLHQCLHLRVLMLDGYRGVFLCQVSPLHIVLDDTHSTCLTELHISSISCGLLDLSQAAALTAIVLDFNLVESVDHLSLRLPPTLLSFDFTSRTALVYQPSASRWFTPCIFMTSLTICLNVRASEASNCSLPELPSSLCLLSLFMSDKFMRALDWRCLQHCTRLEHIELPATHGDCVPDNLRDWLDTARHLRVVMSRRDAFKIEHLPMV